jgi:iron complex outermembrane recepter protein
MRGEAHEGGNMHRLSAVLLASTMISTPVFAQQASQDASPKTSAGVEVVVVTAQKRTERLQDVPVAVSVASGDQLTTEHILNSQELQYAIPELSMAGSPQSFAIRGVGTQSYTRSAESDVSVVVDGVLLGQNATPQNGLFDVQRVEVLSGPQGMLFGKNASAGVVNIVTNAPQLNDLELIGHADFGERGFQNYQGVANLPVSDDAALRVSAFGDYFGDFETDLFNGRHYGWLGNYGGRARLLWQPNSDVTVNIIADFENDNGASFWTPRSLAGPLAPFITACGVRPGPDNLSVCDDAGTTALNQSYGLSAQVDWQIGDLTLTSVTADRRFSRYGNGDTDDSPVNILDVNMARDFSNQFSQELRLASPTDERVEYVAGLYFYDYDYKPYVNQAGTIGLPFLADRASVAYIDQLSYAVFGQATVHLFDDLSLILGGRETRDELGSTTTNFVDPSYGVYVPGFSVLGVSGGKADTDNFSFRTGLQYKFDPDTLFYVTFARGYKGPAVNNIAPGISGESIVRPEIPLDWEGGVKTSFFSNKVALDLSVFDETIKDFQAQVFAVEAGFGQFTFANASRLFVRGFEANVSAHPTDGLTLQGGVIDDDATYDNFVVQCDAGYTVGCSLVGGSLVTNAKGLQLVGAPRWKFTAAAQYDRPALSGFDGFIEADINYRTMTRSVAAPDPNADIAAYALFNARIGVHTDDGRYSVALFGKNIFDKRFPTLIFPDPVLPVAGNYDQSFSADSFRIIGLSLDVRY